jgi:hypothetical protein
MGIFTYIKIGIIAVLVIVCSYLVWNYHHMEAKIAAQKIQIDNLKLEQDVLKKKQQAFDEFMAKKSVVKRKVANEEQQVDQTVDSGDVTRIIDMFHRLRPNQIEPPAHGGTGRAKPAPGRAASP